VAGPRTSFELDEALRRRYDLKMDVERTPATNPVESSVESKVADNIVSPPRVKRRARWAELVYLVALSLYAALATLAHSYAYFGWDLSLARSIQSVPVPGFAILMIAVSFLGGWISWPIVVVSSLALIKMGLRKEGLVCIVGTAVGAAVNLLVKMLVGRPRPTDVLINVTRAYRHESFPSGHVVFFIEFFGFLFFLSYVLLERGRLRRIVLSVLGLLIALVGVSRVYLGAHWPSDVLGAYLAGGIWLILMIEVYRRIKERSPKPTPEIR